MVQSIRYQKFKKHWNRIITEISPKSFSKTQCVNIQLDFEKEAIDLKMHFGCDYEDFNRIETRLNVALESAYSNYRRKDSLVSRLSRSIKNFKLIIFSK